MKWLYGLLLVTSAVSSPINQLLSSLDTLDRIIQSGSCVNQQCSSQLSRDATLQTTLFELRQSGIDIPLEVGDVPFIGPTISLVEQDDDIHDTNNEMTAISCASREFHQEKDKQAEMDIHQLVQDLLSRTTQQTQHLLGKRQDNDVNSTMHTRHVWPRVTVDVVVHVLRYKMTSLPFYKRFFGHQAVRHHPYHNNYPIKKSPSPIQNHAYQEYVSDARAILSQLQVLNQEFNEAGFQFQHSKIHWIDLSREYSHHPEYITETFIQGPRHDLLSKYRMGNRETLNIYITNLNQTLLGYSSLAQDVEHSFKQDGVVMNRRAILGIKEGAYEMHHLGMTLVHEVGHWLGLWHTFQGNCTYPNDFIDDTPPRHSGYSSTCPHTQESSFFSRLFYLETSPSTAPLCQDKDFTSPYDQAFYRYHSELQHHDVRFYQGHQANHMEYFPDACLGFFTRMQIARMHACWKRYRLSR